MARLEQSISAFGFLLFIIPQSNYAVVALIAAVKSNNRSCEAKGPETLFTDLRRIFYI